MIIELLVDPEIVFSKRFPKEQFAVRIPRFNWRQDMTSILDSMEQLHDTVYAMKIANQLYLQTSDLALSLTIQSLLKRKQRLEKFLSENCQLTDEVDHF